MKKFLIIILAFISSISYSQEIKNYKSSDKILITDSLKEVTVIAGTNYQAHQTFVEPEIYKNSVQIQQTSPGQLSPYLGGFTGDRVDQVINGIRINNSLFRTGPNQYFGWIPFNFTTSIITSDGGNIGGTISREVGITHTGADVLYNTGNNGMSEFISYKGKKLSIGINNIKTNNVITVNGVIPHSAYNQYGVIGDYKWSTNNKTTIIFTQSNDVERTDKWNGGQRIDKYQSPSVYTWGLQRFIMLNHKYTYKNLIINGAYQNFSENILDKTTNITSRLNSLTLNGEYFLTNNLSCYSSNTVEHINYQTEGINYVPNDLYSTFKQGLRWRYEYKGYKIYLSGGYKTVTITDIKPFNGIETSLIVGKNGFFGSYSKSLNPPGYLMIKQSITTGKGVQLPNLNLKQEECNSYRIGYRKNGFYVDVNYRNLTNAINTVFLTSDTIQTINEGYVNVWSSNFGYNKDNVFNTGINLKSHAEYIYGYSSTGQPIDKITPFRSYVKLDRKGIWIDWLYETKDDSMSDNDLKDVRQYGHNVGVNIFSLGYTGKFKHFNYGISVYNILNTESRIKGSSVDLPKRSIIFNLGYDL